MVNVTKPVFILLLLTAVWLPLPGHAESAPAVIQTGENWIQNQRVRVTLQGRTVSVYLKTGDPGTWNRVSSGQLSGLLTPEELMKPYREKYHTYYLFGKEATVAQVRTSVCERAPVLAFRLALEDLWLDTEITILGDGALVLFSAAAKSCDELVPHWVQNFHQTWAAKDWWMPAMTHLVFDDPAGEEPKGLAAVDYREIHKFPASSRYCLAVRPGTDRIWGFLWPPDGGKPAGRRTIQFPPGALVNAYLNAPYVLVTELTEDAKDIETMSRLGEALYRQMADLFK